MNKITDQIKLCDLLMDDITQSIKTRAVIIQFDEHHDRYISDYSTDGQIKARGCKQDQILDDIRKLRRELLNLADFVKEGRLEP